MSRISYHQMVNLDMPRVVKSGPTIARNSDFLCLEWSGDQL